MAARALSVLGAAEFLTMGVGFAFPAAYLAYKYSHKRDFILNLSAVSLSSVYFLFRLNIFANLKPK